METFRREQNDVWNKSTAYQKNLVSVLIDALNKYKSEIVVYLNQNNTFPKPVILIKVNQPAYKNAWRWVWIWHGNNL